MEVSFDELDISMNVDIYVEEGADDDLISAGPSSTGVNRIPCTLPTLFKPHYIQTELTCNMINIELAIIDELEKCYPFLKLPLAF